MKTCTTGFIFLLLSGLVLAACTNGGGLTGSGSGAPTPLPSGGIGLGIPTARMGVESDPTWGTVGGYTQNKTSQVLAFPPGTMLTIHNLSSVDAHTLNVLAPSNGPPPKWPKDPSLSFSPMGNGILGSGYASGTVQPGASVTVKLSNPGIYLIGCAFHYIGFNMRDVIQVENGASPGPTASPGPGGYALLHARVAPRRATAAPRAHAQPQLIDQNGRHFTLASLIGEPLAITFVAARCTDACPLINAQFAMTAQRLARANVRARLLTMTLDPRHDTPEVMSSLARRFEADSRYWTLASGSTPDVDEVLRNFGVVARQGEHGYPDAHTTFVYLIDASGNLTQTMLASSALRDELFDALRAGARRLGS